MSSTPARARSSGNGAHKADWSQWHTKLTQYAKQPNPKKSAPELDDLYLRHDAHTLAIYDKFPKARFHFLVLPRLPFVLDSDKATEKSNGQSSVPAEQASAPKLALAGGKLSMGASKSGSTVPPAHLHSLADLLASPYASQVLARMRQQAMAVADLIRQEMRHARGPSSSAQACGVEWGVRMGFHAVPSMDTVHLHVISEDFVSDSLKHKKHYNSFKPQHGFWLDLGYIEDLVSQGQKRLPRKAAEYEALLKAPLTSFRDGKEYSNMPKLKEHLKDAWTKDIVTKQRQKSEEVSGIRSKRAADESSATPPPSKEAKSSPSRRD